jgi:hypothetical protein
MTKPQKKSDPIKHLDSAPQSALERELISEYLKNKGYRLKDLKKLPQAEAKRLMKEACQYASLKLAEIEARAGFSHKIKYDSS